MDLFISRNFPPKQQIGDDLSHQADLFSAWYLYWLSEPQKHSETFQILARIKKVAEFSIQGNYMTKSHEKKACDILATIQHIPREEFDTKLLQLLSDLTHNQPIATIIDQITQLQQKILIPKTITDEILGELRPDLPEVNAKAVIVYLAKILEEPTKALEGLPQVLDWLKA